MFVMNSTVRERTITYPTNASEEAVEVVLQTLRTAVREATDLVLSDEPPLAELAELAEDIGSAATAIVDRWQLLERQSPYRLAGLEEAVSAVEGLIGIAEETTGRAAAALSLERDLAALVAAHGRALLSDRLPAGRGSRSIRALAKEVDIALGYLSDLEAGRVGPPSADVCEKLQRATSIELSDVHAARDRADELKRAYRRRTARTRRTSAVGGTLPREDARLRALATAAIDDPQLLDLVDAIRQLPPGVRRGLEALVSELRHSITEARDRRDPLP